MKKQFLHEHHNRQDKRLKLDYRVEISERGRSEASSDTEKLNAKVQSRPKSIKAKRETVRRWRRAKFFHAGHVVKLGWPLAQFAKANALPSAEPTTKAAHDAIRAVAERDMQKISDAIMSGFVRYKRPFVFLPSIPYVEWECSELECNDVKLR
ncbi:MAG: hypothetical protein IH623_08205 [Verrucomicrobia bacterium]|nr:hypothetical protein [Verrucomicrobiota bacterium]